MMKKKKYKRTDFKRCPNYVIKGDKLEKCEGMLCHNSPTFGETECIKCGLVLRSDCCYTEKGKVIEGETEFTVIRITNKSEKR
jgi:hypothetical protein